MQQAQRPLGGDRKRGSPYGSQARVSSAGLNDSPRGSHHYRERSSSNRNLQDASKLQIQPRRASDEVATSSSYRLVTRLSPGASRRSISVMNVGDGFVVGSNRLPSSRLGSQASILKTRRDSSQFQLQLLQRQRDHSNSGSPTKYGEGSPNTSSISRISDSQATIGLTPSGRRSSLAGIQSLTGYRSQKNSQSDATEHDSPLNTIKRPREHNVATQQQQLPTGNDISLPRPSAIHQTQQEKQCQRQVNSGPTSTRPSCSSNSNSRRGSSEQQTPNRLQRRGSFATQTLRKLKRTLSLNKGNGGSQSGSNQESRRSSSSSDRSVSELGEDLAVTRTTKSSGKYVLSNS